MGRLATWTVESIWVNNDMHPTKFVPGFINQDLLDPILRVIQSFCEANINHRHFHDHFRKMKNEVLCKMETLLHQYKKITIFSGQSYNAWTQFPPNTNVLLVTKSCIYEFDFIFYKLRFCLWLWLLWYLRHCLVPKVFSQNPHWREIPSKWFASMWSLMLFTIPSFPQTLQM